MASIGDLKGRVVITNASAGVLGKVRADMDAIANASRRLNTNFSQYISNLQKSAQHNLNRLRQNTSQHAAAAGAAGLGFKGLIDQTKGFNESKFGYGFATLTDYMKDGRLEMDAWRQNMDRVANEVRAKAKDFGLLPEIVMQAREEVEKLGFKGKDAASLWEAALGLHMSEPTKLASGQASQFLGAVYRAFENERKAMAVRMGKSADDPEFVAAYMKSLAAKAAVAGAESALGPADVIEGMRQYAPQWASLGISYDFALAALAHGANYGFRAPELGTAYKSMANRAIRPTAEGMRWYNRLGIDRSKYMEMDVADPKRATNQMNGLLGNALGRKHKGAVERMLIEAQRAGTTTSPEFRGRLASDLERRLGKGFAGRREQIEQAITDTVLAPKKFKDGGFDGLIRDIIKSGAGPAALATMFEGKHIARNDPMFKFYEKMYSLFEKIQKVDGSVMDAVTAGRKGSEAGKTDAMAGSWQNLMIQLEQAGGLVDMVKDAFTRLNQALATLPKEALTGITAGGMGIGAIGAAALLVGGLPALWKMGKFAGRMTGIPWALGSVGAAGSAVAGSVLGRMGYLPRHGIVGAPIGVGAGAGGAWMGQVAAARQLSLLGKARVIALGAGRFLIPGLGVVSAAAMGWGAYEGYKATGTVGGAVRGALGLGQANAAPAAPSGVADNKLSRQRTNVPRVSPESLVQPQAEASPDEQIRMMTDRMRATLQAVDFTAEGQRIVGTIAAGIRAGAADVDAALGEVTSRMRQQMNAVRLNTGPAIGAAR